MPRIKTTPTVRIALWALRKLEWSPRRGVCNPSPHTPFRCCEAPCSSFRKLFPYSKATVTRREENGGKQSVSTRLG
jgi:hypothetical protein